MFDALYDARLRQADIHSRLPGIALATAHLPSLQRAEPGMNESVNRVRDVLAELIKAALLSDDQRSLDCRTAAARAQKALVDDPPEPGALKIDGAWTLAIQEAERPELQPLEGRVNLTLPRASVIGLDELLRSDFDVDEAVRRIGESASTG